MIGGFSREWNIEKDVTEFTGYLVTWRIILRIRSGLQPWLSSCHVFHLEIITYYNPNSKPLTVQYLPSGKRLHSYGKWPIDRNRWFTY